MEWNLLLVCVTQVVCQCLWKTCVRVGKQSETGTDGSRRWCGREGGRTCLFIPGILTWWVSQTPTNSEGHAGYNLLMRQSKIMKISKQIQYMMM